MDREKIILGIDPGTTIMGFGLIKVKGKTIVAVTVVSNRASPYDRYAEGVISRVLNNQSPAVDAITKATTSSKMLLKAVENALSGAARIEE